MKASLLTAIFVLSVLLLHAQSSDINPHFPRSGDVMYYLDFKAADVVTEYGGENHIWDFSKAEMIDNGNSISFCINKDKPSAVVAVDGNTRIYYAENAQGIVCLGFENNQTKVEYDIPTVVIPCSDAIENSVVGTFHGYGMYCEKAMMRVCGIFSSAVDGRGTLLLPDGKKIENVFRLCSRKTERGIVYTGLRTRSELIAYVDSISPFNADSIKACINENPDDVIHTETFRWYATGYRYPIIEITNYSTGNSKPYARTARCCMPDEQEKLYDPANENIRLKTKNQDNVAKGSEENISGSDGTRPYSITKGGNEITVYPTGPNSGNLCAILADSSGIVFKTANSHNDAPAVINFSGLHSGEYILYIETDGVTYTEKVKI